MLKHNVRFWLLRLAGMGLMSAAGSVALPQPGLAQNAIVPDATLGSEASQVVPFAPLPTVDLIQGGAVRGQNLFHSFEAFNINSGNAAYFIIEAANISNIFARVTGSDISSLFGALGIRQQLGPGSFATPNTDLFLLNPNGIIFGPGFSLDLQGSFIATTADAIEFSDQGVFSTTSADEPSSLLTINPSALWFNQSEISPILFQGARLNLLPEQRLLLLGGDIDFNANQIFALGTDVIIGGLSSPGQVSLKLENDDWQTSFNPSSERSNVQLRNNSEIFLIPYGSILVDSRNLTISNSSGIASVSGSLARMLLNFLGLQSPEGGGIRSITINADENIELTDVSLIASAIIGSIEEDEGAEGFFQLRGQNLNLLNGSLIGSISLGEGSADDVNIEVDDTLLLAGIADDGTLSLIGSPTGSAGGSIEVPGFGFLSDFIGIGDGGNITITAKNIILERGTQIGANNFIGSGRAGNLDITVLDSLRASDFAQLRTETTGTGDAGNITIRSGNEVVFMNGAQIRSETSGGGDGGNIDIYAVNRVVFNGIDDFDNRSGITSSVNPIEEFQDNRRAGSITIQTDPTGTFFLSNGATIYSNVESGGVGRGGDIDIQSGSILLTNGSQIQSILRDAAFDLPGAQGETGKITIRADRDFSAIGRDNSGLPSGLFTIIGIGSIGTSNEIYVEADLVSLINGGRLSTETAGLGNSGTITVMANGPLLIEEELPNSIFTSGIFTRVNQAAIGNGGDILINAQSLTMRALPDSPISFTEIDATTSGLGNSGNIALQIDEDVNLSGQSLIFSQVSNNGRGQAGDIAINSRSLTMMQGAEVAASIFRAENGLLGGIGEGGDIQINAADFVDIEGIGPGGFSGGIFSNTQSGASGTGGDIIMTTGALRIANGAVVTAQTLNESDSGNIDIIADAILLENGGQIVADTRSGGNAGKIDLAIAGDIIISGVDSNYSNRFIQFPNASVANVSERSGIFVPTSQNSTGDGGSIFVQSGSLAILEGGQVSAESSGSGLAGNIEILANSSGQFNYGSTPVRYALLMRNGDITTQAQQSAGGNISIISLGTAPILLLEDSDITTDSLGNGGNITLDSLVMAFDDSDILARSSDARGGNITLGPFFSDTLPIGAVSPTENNDRVDVSADGRLASGVITTPDTSFIQNSLNQLPAVVIDPNTLIAGSCIARTAEGQGTFVNTGSGGLPARPGDGVISAYPTGSVQSLPGAAPQTIWQPGDPIVEPTGTFTLPDGRLVLARACDEN